MPVISVFEPFSSSKKLKIGPTLRNDSKAFCSRAPLKALGGSYCVDERVKDVKRSIEAERFSKVQRALSEPKRLEILETVRRNSQNADATCSCVLKEMTISQSTFSHHISELADAELLLERKSGKFSILSVNEAVVEEYVNELKRRLLPEV